MNRIFEKLLFRCFLAVGLFTLLGLGRAPAASPLRVTFFDIGQGDATLLQTPGGKTVLIDGGPVEEMNGFDAGRDIIAPFLIKENIRKIDFAVMTHPHMDHIGGFLHLFQEFPVGQVYDPGYSYPSEIYRDILKVIREKKIHYQVLRSGENLAWDRSLDVRTVGPPQILPWDNPNDISLIIRVAHGDVSFLFTGDVEKEGEYEMVIRHGPSVASRILKVAHHGSRTSSTEEFLDYVQPEVAVISCGRRNRFRHPSKRVLNRFEDYGVQLYRTDEQGSIRVTSNGRQYEVEALGIQ